MFAESISYSAAFFAGILSFFSPCILPLIPGYFTFITGFSMEDLTSRQNNQIRKRVIISTLAYVLGFSLVFILLGASASFLGTLIQQYSHTIRVAGGILIIILGIHLTGLIRFTTLDMEKRFHIKKRPLHFLGTFTIGMAFAAGWSPCIGPLLGSVLILAGNQDSMGEGMILLAIYSGGLAIPFMLISVFIHYILKFIQKISGITKFINPTAGIFLIILGLILITDKLYLFSRIG